VEVLVAGIHHTIVDTAAVDTAGTVDTARQLKTQQIQKAADQPTRLLGIVFAVVLIVIELYMLLVVQSS
jgi:hypothetical protein